MLFYFKLMLLFLLGMVCGMLLIHLCINSFDAKLKALEERGEALAEKLSNFAKKL